MITTERYPTKGGAWANPVHPPLWAIPYSLGIAAQGNEWVDAIRYFRGMGPSRHRATHRWLTSLLLLALLAATVVAAVDQFG